MAPASEPTRKNALDTTSTILFGLDEIERHEDSVDATTDPSSAEDALAAGLPPQSALLVVRRGPNAGSRFLLDAEVTTAGRNPESDIFLDDVTVSRRHAEIMRDGVIFTVRDVGSLNGTYVNRERVESVVLSHGDEVQIGKFRLVFVSATTGEAVQ